MLMWIWADEQPPAQRLVPCRDIHCPTYPRSHWVEAGTERPVREIAGTRRAGTLRRLLGWIRAAPGP